eukprot:CAMPEP_0185848358 /NCGR_PEP_ID=MMETSP1354-20130828/3274_1 /TAXON_ID=708628 /ORGANISM="Erythrolobus madagascarensis, Strain CCMP3276" /LENGTH=984 /DNA_ID=CAMNT_0028548749 /DNA_START=458 /DNA_END=3412 /DNA_ORIENTATION=-
MTPLNSMSSPASAPQGDLAIPQANGIQVNGAVSEVQAAIGADQASVQTPLNGKGRALNKARFSNGVGENGHANGSNGCVREAYGVHESPPPDLGTRGRSYERPQSSENMRRSGSFPFLLSDAVADGNGPAQSKNVEQNGDHERRRNGDLSGRASNGAASHESAFVHGIYSTGDMLQHTLDSSVVSIALDGLGLVSVSIPSPLDTSSGSSLLNSLQECSLSGNLLVSIDLTPLGSCARLKSLLLNGNNFRSLDLSPLRNCSSLRRLWLHDNELQSLNLEPLASCLELNSLYADNNKINSSTIDLTPLAPCLHLRSLRLNGNKLNESLDVTPLLSMVSLASLTVDTGVHLRVRKKSRDCRLPPALRRLREGLSFCEWQPGDEIATTNGSTTPMDTWMNGHGTNGSQSSSSKEDAMVVSNGNGHHQNGGSPSFGANGCSSPSSSQKAQPLAALLVNFGVREFYCVRDALHRLGDFKCTGVTDLMMESEHLNSYAMVMVHVPLQPSSLGVTIQVVKQIRALCPHVPLVCTGHHIGGDLAAKFGRNGADRCTAMEITAQESRSLHALACERAHMYSDERRVARHARSSGCLRSQVSAEDPFALIKQGTLPPLSSIRRSYTVAGPNLIGGYSRNAMERHAIEKLFQRYNCVIAREQMGPITTLCGLPSCASALLVRSVLLHVDRNQYERCVHMSDFVRFWIDRFDGSSSEQRFYNMMRILATARSSRLECLLSLSEALLRGVRLLSGAELDLVQTVAELILFRLNGAAWSELQISERAMRRAQFCSGLISVESDLFDGAFAILDPARLAEYVNQFESLGGRASNDPQLSCELQPSDIISLCQTRGSLIPRAVTSVFTAHLGGIGRSMRLGDFAKFWVAQLEVSSASAIEYWFHVLDEDLDGYVSREDAHSFYSEKVPIRLTEGVHLCEFGNVWASILDMVAPRYVERGFTLSEMLGLPEKHRRFIVQALLYRNDGNAVIDVRRSSNLMLM